ncbi:MAG: CU044_5270 family protein [Solirubrobacteraceae bacterium]
MRTDLDLELIRELHPADRAHEAAGERARAALMAEIDRALLVSAPTRRRTRLASVGLAAALAAVVAGIVLALSLRGGAANPPSAAALVLQRAARVAEAAGGPRQLRPGEYWYVKSIWTTPGVQLAEPSGRASDTIVNALSTYERQAWIGLDRPGRVESHVVGPITFLSAAARRQWIRAGRAPELPGFSGSLPPNAFIEPYQKLLSLPTNVDALYRLLYREAGTRPGQASAAWKRHEMFTEIGDLLREDPIPAKVRAALYRVAARIPGIQVLGLTHDGIGRPALAVALNDTLYGMRSELLFDPKTSVLLGERSVVVKPPPAYHVKPDTVHEGATYITSGIVERVGQVPER